MRIVHSSFSGSYARVVVQYGTKERPVVFGPFAPPLPHEPKVSDPLKVIDTDKAIEEIASQTGQPIADVRVAVTRYLAGAGRFTTPEDWYERFKAAGGRGRVDAEKIWFSESGPQSSKSAAIIAELLGPEKEDAYKQVVAYIQARCNGFSGWAEF